MNTFECYECGKENELSANYCKFCGSAFSKDHKPNEALNDFPNSYDNTQVPSHTPSQVSSEADSKATTGMVLAIVSIFIPIPVIDIIVAIIAISMGNKAQTLPNLTRQGQAQAAVIVGIISVILGIFYALLWF